MSNEAVNAGFALVVTSHKSDTAAPMTAPRQISGKLTKAGGTLKRQ